MNTPRIRSRLSKGFNLIEAAIVLGVVGLVIGGIWVAASSVSYKFKLSETAKGILLAVESIRNLQKGMPCVDTTYKPWEIGLGPASQWPPAPDAGGATVATPLGVATSFIIECAGTSGVPVIHIPMGQTTFGYSYDECLNMNRILKVPNPDGTLHDDGNFREMGGSGGCIPNMGMVSYYWYLYPTN